MKKLLLSILVVFLSFTMLIPAPVFAEDGSNCVNTAILGEGGEVCDEGNGDSIMHILQLVVDIMSIGVGILGVIGITWAGIKYLTAGGNEEKTRTAKRRIFEIVIGLVAYALIYAVLSWLRIGTGTE